MWLKTNYEFGIPMADFTISVRELVACKLRDELGVVKEKPEAVEKLVKDLVRFYRPSLADATVVALQFSHMQWIITLSHPSLERVTPGVFPKQYRLCEGETRCRDAIEIDPLQGLDPSGRLQNELRDMAEDSAKKMVDPGLPRIGDSYPKPTHPNCCKVGCTQTATHGISMGYGQHSYGCDEHAKELTGEGEMAYPLFLRDLRDYAEGLNRYLQTPSKANKQAKQANSTVTVMNPDEG